MTINNYFGFSKPPFCKNVNCNDVYHFNDFKNLTNRFNFFLTQRGIFLLTGMIGSGKTTAIKVFTAGLNPNQYRVIYFSDNYATKRDLYRTILSKLNTKAPFLSGDAREIIRKIFLEMYCIKKITPILIFDEAQNLNGFILEELRLLSNFDFDSITPALFIISGHNKLKHRIIMRENEALNQRITLKFHFNGLTEEQTVGYIHHCLTKVESSNAIFADSVLSKIHNSSAGILRIINNICNDLLLSAMILNKKIIDDHVFDQTSGEWQ